MNGKLAAPKAASWLGLVLALGGLFALGKLYDLLPWPSGSLLVLAGKQLLYFALLGMLIWLVRTQERLPLSSMGWRTDAPLKSLLWGLAGFLLLCLAFGASTWLDSPLHLKWDIGGTDQPTALAALIVLRAGIVEEALFRGYAMERIKQLTGSTLLTLTLPLCVFTLYHLYLGSAGMLNAFLMGGVLTGLYWWRRDLMANMISHFLVDFVSLVVFPWLAQQS